MPNRVTNSKAEDSIELLAFLTAPGVLKITIGGQSYVQSAPAGVTSFKIASQPGSRYSRSLATDRKSFISGSRADIWANRSSFRRD